MRVNIVSETFSLFSWLKTILIFFSILLATIAFGRQKAPKIEVGEPLVSKLSVVFARADDLRGALVQRQEPMAIAKLKELEISLNEALRTPDSNRQVKEHLDRILSEAMSNVKRVPSLRGEERRAILQNAFKQIVLIGQTYKVTNEYKFFFCGRDRSVWLQKDGKPKNPISPEHHLNCGTRVE